MRSDARMGNLVHAGFGRLKIRIFDKKNAVIVGQLRSVIHKFILPVPAYPTMQLDGRFYDHTQRAVVRELKDALEIRTRSRSPKVAGLGQGPIRY